MNEAQVIELLRTVCAALREPLTDELIRSWTWAFRDADPVKTEENARRWVLTNTKPFFPKPGELAAVATDRLDPADYRGDNYLRLRGEA